MYVNTPDREIIVLLVPHPPPLPGHLEWCNARTGNVVQPDAQEPERWKRRIRNGY